MESAFGTRENGEGAGNGREISAPRQSLTRQAALDELKTQLRGAQIVLRSKTPELVKQEFYGLLMAHFAIRGLMHEAALQSGEDPDRLSRRMARFASIPRSSRNRINPRGVKRKMSSLQAASPETEAHPTCQFLGEDRDR